MNMTFDSFYVDSSDFDFYMSLPEDEKLLFLYDFICTDFYTENDSPEFINNHFSDDINSNSFRNVISTVLDKAIDYDSHVNVIFINELVVFNSHSKRNLAYAILDMSFEGVLLSKIDVPENLIHVFKKQEYFEVYKVLEIIDPILTKI